MSEPLVSEYMEFPDGHIETVYGEQNLKKARKQGARVSEPVLIRYPNGFVSSVSPRVADILLRKKQGHRVVKAMPPVDLSKIKIGGEE